MKGMFRDLRVIIIAVLASMLVAAAPSMARSAYDAMNADNVDGHGAVGAKVAPAHRAGSLIAANSAGYLPSNAIRKAPNSAKLDGAPRSAFLQRTSDFDELQTGTWAVSGPAGTVSTASIEFLEDLKVRVLGSAVYFVNPGESTVQCPGPGEVVAQGTLCVYIQEQSNLDSLHIRNALTGSYGTSLQGAALIARFTADGYSFGTWAVRSGN